MSTTSSFGLINGDSFTTTPDGDATLSSTSADQTDCTALRSDHGSKGGTNPDIPADSCAALT